MSFEKLEDSDRCNHRMKRGNYCGRVFGHNGRHESYETLEWKKDWRKSKREDDPTYCRISPEAYADRQAFIDRIKIESGCADCGYDRYPEALDFDHLPGFEKSGNVAAMKTYAMPRLLREIAKCEVVCANCHRHRTRERGYGHR